MVEATAWTRGDVFGLAGLIVSGVGFAIAIWQLARTANAAEATQQSLLTSSRTQFLFLLPQFRQLEIELDLSIGSDNRVIAARALSGYAYLANEVAALIEELGLAGPDVVSDIRTAGIAAAEAKSDIYAAKNKKLSTITNGIEAQMRTVTDHVSRLRATHGSMVSQTSTRRWPWGGARAAA